MKRLVLVTLLGVALGCGGDKKDGEPGAEQEVNPLTAMGDQEACEAFFARMSTCSAEIETESIKIEGDRLEGFGANLRSMAAKRKTICVKQGKVLRRGPNSPYGCFPRTGCDSFAACIARVAKAAATDRKRQMIEERRKAVDQAPGPTPMPTP